MFDPYAQPYKRPPRVGPYCGFLEKVDPATRRKIYVPAETDSHIWVLARTGAGKTTLVLAPMAIAHEGPAVIVSSKDDLMQWVLPFRPGPSKLIDLRTVRNPMYPKDIEPVRFDPTTSIQTVDDAYTTASTLLQMASTAYGAGAQQVTDGGTWESLGEGPLAAFLYVASPAKTNLGMRWVLQAIQKPILFEDDPPDTPSWSMAAEEVGIPELKAEIDHASEMDPKQRDSILFSLSKATRAWLRMALREQPEGAFTPEFLDNPQATVYVMAPGNGTTAPAAVTLIEQLVERWREKTSQWEDLSRLLGVIDEAPNTAPMPRQANYVGEARGLGANLAIAQQASNQTDITHGPIYTEVLRKIFPAVCVMHGAAEEELLRAAAQERGVQQRRGEAQSVDGGRNQSGRLEQEVEWQELMSRSPDKARLLLRGTVGKEVYLPHVTEFVSKFWPKMAQNRGVPVKPVAVG